MLSLNNTEALRERLKTLTKIIDAVDAVNFNFVKNRVFRSCLSSRCGVVTEFFCDRYLHNFLAVQIIKSMTGSRNKQPTTNQ
jgi:hypothetical protein